MPTSISSNKRIAKNTIYLYLRMALIMIVNLFVVRVILNTLGAEDYGIYNVVAGTVTFFTFIGTSLASGATRFFAIDIGKNEFDKLKITFSLTIYIYWGIGIISILLLESIGTWFLNTKLNIPENRLFDANIVFQFAILTFLSSIFTIPYNAAVIAFEKMYFFAILGSVEAIAKLLVAFSLVLIPSNKLILYAVLLCIVSFSILIIYIIYVKTNLKGCSLIKVHDFSLAKDLLKYSCWNMIGTSAIIFRNQGIIILLNLFFNPIINAAQTIAQQIYGVINQLIANVYLASRPQITKQYSINELNNMWNLIFFSGKIAYFLLLVIIIPLFICMDFILKQWLGHVPEYTVVICRLLLISLCIETFTNQLFGGFQAANRLKRVQGISSSIMLLNLPVSYLILTFNAKVSIPYMVIIVLSIIYSISIIIIAKIDLQMSLQLFLRKLFLPSLFVLLSAPIIPFIIHHSHSIQNGWIDCAITILGTIISMVITTWFLGLTKDEKNKLLHIIKSKLK